MTMTQDPTDRGAARPHAEDRLSGSGAAARRRRLAAAGSAPARGSKATSVPSPSARGRRGRPGRSEHGYDAGQVETLLTALAKLTHSGGYRVALAADLSERHDVDGQAVEPVSVFDRHSAALVEHAKALHDAAKAAKEPRGAHAPRDPPKPTRPSPPARPPRPPRPLPRRPHPSRRRRRSRKSGASRARSARRSAWAGSRPPRSSGARRPCAPRGAGHEGSRAMSRLRIATLSSEVAAAKRRAALIDRYGMASLARPDKPTAFSLLDQLRALPPGRSEDAARLGLQWLAEPGRRRSGQTLPNGA